MAEEEGKNAIGRRNDKLARAVRGDDVVVFIVFSDSVERICVQIHVVYACL